MTIPQPLKRGDRVAIVSPAGIIKPQLVYETMPVLADQGWVPYVGVHTFDRHGTYAGTDEARLYDLREALLDPGTRAILCSRGGYGAVHLLEELDKLPIADDPKWVVGYSDISALHALMNRHGVASLHAPMCKHIATSRGTDRYSRAIFDILSGAGQAPVVTGGHPLDRPGTATGTVAGGNLAVIAGLLSTPFDVVRPGSILFIEDISEPIYKTERILYTLRLSGALADLAGLVVGRFTDYSADLNASTMEEMIAEMTAPYGYPVAYRAPIGHVSDNMPVIAGAKATLTVTSRGGQLVYA